MEKLVLKSHSPQMTEKIGFCFGRFLFDKLKSYNDFLLIALVGEYGSGKTVFTKGICSNLKKKFVTSPTFIIMNIYERKIKKVVHIDACRIKSEDDFKMLGVEDFYNNSLVVIEWADKILNCLPEERIELYLRITGKNKRSLTFVNRTRQNNLLAEFKKVGKSRTFSGSFSL